MRRTVMKSRFEVFETTLGISGNFLERDCGQFFGSFSLRTMRARSHEDYEKRLAEGSQSTARLAGCRRAGSLKRNSVLSALAM